MKIVRIFVKDEGETGLWSIHLDGRIQNEFDYFFDLMNNVEYLHNFFEKNKTDLMSGFFGKMTTGDAVLRTLEEVEEMENALYNYTERGFSGNGNCLQHLFKPLNNYEYAICSHQKSKARLKRGWLRMYALRLEPNCYLITGGAIKLTYNMKPTHLQNELTKLEQAKTFLKNNDIEFPEDLNTYQDD
jgi:hypothetical protein